MIKLFNDDILNVKLDGISPNLIIISPPYNVGIKYNSYNDNLTYKNYIIWVKQWIKKLYNIMPDDGRICINVPFTITPSHLRNDNEEHINYPVAADYIKICQKIKFKYWRTIIWEKFISNASTTWGSFKMASAPFMRDPSEAIIVCYKNQWKRLTRGESTISGLEFMKCTKNLWHIHSEIHHNEHPSPFPLELPELCIKLFSYKSDYIMDCFMGIGSTGIVAARLERNFIGIEIDKDYFQKAKDRIECAEFQTNLRRDYFPPEDDSEKTFDSPPTM